MFQRLERYEIALRHVRRASGVAKGGPHSAMLSLSLYIYAVSSVKKADVQKSTANLTGLGGT